MPRKASDQYPSLNFLRFPGYHQYLEGKKKELFQDIQYDYAGYPECFANNFDALIKYFSAHGIKIRKLKLLVDTWSYLMKTKFVAIGIGPMIGVEQGPYIESTTNHESIHVEQYRENGIFKNNFLAGWIGFLRFGIGSQLFQLLSLKKSREKYGEISAYRYAVNNTPMEFEAFMHEGDSRYLDHRTPFAYKKYASPEGRSAAVSALISQNIEEMIGKVEELYTKLENKYSLSLEDVILITDSLDELIHAIPRLVSILEKHTNEDWELVSEFSTPKGPIVWLESEKNKKKRHDLLDVLHFKEDSFLLHLKTNAAKLSCLRLSSHHEIRDQGRILLSPKKGSLQELHDRLLQDKAISSLHPHIRIPSGKDYLEVSFLTV